MAGVVGREGAAVRRGAGRGVGLDAELWDRMRKEGVISVTCKSLGEGVQGIGILPGKLLIFSYLFRKMCIHF